MGDTQHVRVDVADPTHNGNNHARPQLTGMAWDQLLEAIAAGDTEVVLETASGGRVALVAERRLVELRGHSVSHRRPVTNALSGREREVLTLASEGMRGAAIAQNLGLAVNTVAQHLVSARRKLAVKSTAEAITAARRIGQLP